MSTALVVFTRDLRTHDHVALARAIDEADTVVPAFVLDDTILAGSFNRPNRTGFLVECLADLDRALRELGGALVVRRGDWVREVAALAEEYAVATVHLSADVSRYAQDREARLERELRSAGRTLHRADGVTVVPPGALQPSGGDHFKVFTPYYRRWRAVPLRPPARTPPRIAVPPGLLGDRPDGRGAGRRAGPIPTAAELGVDPGSPARTRGGESEARAALNAWTRTGLGPYGDRHDDLAADATSRISAFLHFGCVSPLEVVTKLRRRAGAEPFIRQICWRDFFHQLLAARPDAAWCDYRDTGFTWDDDPGAFAAWTGGRTGYPVVDAAMRQLRDEGFVHNRARMIVASFLTKDLAQDWRRGARHFLDWLVDGDIANNNLNWQWVAGTGTDTNPHRIFNPTVQGRRFDPDGEYVRRYVPELADVAGGAVHEPWRLPDEERARLDYPPPMVDHHEAIAAYWTRRGG